MKTLQVKLLSKDATLPTKKFKTDSGFDIYAAENEIIRNNETKTIRTDLSINVPDGYEATIRPRSGKTSKSALRVQLGTYDAGYHGPMGVICDCHIQAPYYHVKKGDRIAQLVLQKVELPELEKVDDFSVKTERGERGFGHSDEEGQGHGTE